MNRVKFRAWKKANTPEMFNDIKVIDWIKNIIKIKYPVGNNFRIDEESLDNVILMQYIGLKDKNGTEIYEGDLVQVEGLFPNEPFEVWFRSGLFHIGNWNSQGFMNAFDFYEVVGNVYENPELLIK